MTVVNTSKSRTLSGITDLTLMAPVKHGLIEALDTRSYASRARMVMRTLNNLRLSSREIEPTPMIADLVDRVKAIHSFRVVLIDQEPRQILLNVVFDGGWEPYMRRIWRDLGPLLDLIFCNCEGYPISTSHRFADYAAWVRSVQVETDFFYTAAPVSVGDLHYLRNREHERLTGAPMPEPEPAQTPEDLLAKAMPALVALYRLTDMHPPSNADADAGDGGCLLRAARRLLGNLEGGLGDKIFTDDYKAIAARLQPGLSASECAAIDWFYSRWPKEPNDQPVDSSWNRALVQGGIIEPYFNIAHGCLLLLGLKDAGAARALLDHLLSNDRLVSAEGRKPYKEDAPYHNVAFTLQGMKVAGVPDALLASLPAEFREGMAARAGILGDVDGNHPTRWSLPRANWPAADVNGLPIELSAVHAVVQLQVSGTPNPRWIELSEPSHPLIATVAAFEAALAPQGVRLLTVQALQRFPVDGGLTREAFGFVDGISQPRLDPVQQGDRDRVATGDLLLGHRNSLGDEPTLTGRLWNDSTFLVMRKLKQDVNAFEASANTPEVKAALMGRTPEGDVQLAPPALATRRNAFSFKADPTGLYCPVASHIRRANPRTIRQPDLPAIPRILRRGMSWGPRDGERGVVFMAYNASIAEQFEVIQGWLAGGNSSGPGLYSGQRDPLLGVPLEGDSAAFELQRKGEDVPRRIPLHGDRPFAKLEWGLYLFVPSMVALTLLRELADDAYRLDQAPAVTPEGSERQRRLRDVRTLVAQKGATVIGQLRRAEQAQPLDAVRDLWKTALEDIGARMSGVNEAVWAAVADVHGGALRTPYGVLVGGAELVKQVLADPSRSYTASGYNQRLKDSFGEIYLGMDDRGNPNGYQRLAGPVNRAIQAVDVAESFGAAYVAMRTEVLKYVCKARKGDPVRVEIRDLADAALATLCEQWFGIPHRPFVVAGGWHWGTGATCPGLFGAPSRYTFQPNPGPEALRVGKAHGLSLFDSVQTMMKAGLPDAKNRPILQAIYSAATEPSERASTLIGIMMGFLPTVDGNLRGALWEWIEDRSLWQLQLALCAALRGKNLKDPAEVHPQAQKVLGIPLARTLHLRPVPEMVWRIATQEHSLGNVTVQPGDLVVAGLVGALQQQLAKDELDLSFLFGGYRKEGPSSEAKTDLSMLMQPNGSKPYAAQPTHACPGHRMAWGVMLGFIAGLLCTARLRPTLTSVSLKLSLVREAQSPAATQPPHSTTG